jgi:Ca2+-binding RTX toxin-like protein
MAVNSIAVTGASLLGQESSDSQLAGIAHLRIFMDNSLDDKTIPLFSSLASEDWHASKTDSDQFNLDLNSLQTIALESTEGSKLIFKQQGIVETSKWLNSYDLSNSDNTVKFISNNAYDIKDNSITGAGGNDIVESYNFSNLGESGAKDDVTISQSHKSHGTYTNKNGNSTEKSTFIDTINYIGNGYTLDVATKTDRSYKGSSDVQTETNTMTVSKYKFSNLNDNFSVSVTGSVIDNLKNDNGSSSVTTKVSLTNVNISYLDYTLKSAKVTYLDDGVTDENGMIIKGLANSDNHTLLSITSMQDDIINRIIPNVMDNDNSINITNTKGADINSGNGKDTVIGAAGNDTLTGGAGSDKLTGGKGADTFSFSNADFFTQNSNGDSVFNKSPDTITDFNLKEHDVLEFGDLGELSFYTKFADAKNDNAHLFYVKGSGSIYLNTSTTDGFSPTVIITLTGKPALNADGTDWNYPA